MSARAALSVRRSDISECTACSQGERRKQVKRSLIVRSKEHEGACLYTLTRWRISWCGWISEGGVCGKPRPSVFHRIVALEEHSLVRLQTREIEPALVGIISHRIDLSRSVLEL